MDKSKNYVIVIRNCARLFAAALFTLLAAFFIEHLWQWFVTPFPDAPPFRVWSSQLLHLLILVGLIIAFRWELAGGILILAASFVFFIDKAPPFIVIASLPGVLFLYCWYQSQPSRLERLHPDGRFT
jgi:hypothetical protein